LSITSPNIDQFSKFFQHNLTRKFAIKRSLQIQPYLKDVDTLPCEILMSENSVPYMLGHCFLKYKLARDMTYGRQQLLWQKQVTVIGSIDLTPTSRSILMLIRRLSPSLCAKTAFCSDVVIVIVAAAAYSRSLYEFFNAANANSFLTLNRMKITPFSNCFEQLSGNLLQSVL